MVHYDFPQPCCDRQRTIDQLQRELAACQAELAQLQAELEQVRTRPVDASQAIVWEIRTAALPPWKPSIFPGLEEIW